MRVVGLREFNSLGPQRVSQATTTPIPASTSPWLHANADPLKGCVFIAVRDRSGVNIITDTFQTVRLRNGEEVLAAESRPIRTDSEPQRYQCGGGKRWGLDQPPGDVPQRLSPSLIIAHNPRGVSSRITTFRSGMRCPKIVKHKRGFWI